MTGTIVEVRVFNRHGVDKDERAQAIEREEIERLAMDRDDELAILDRNVYARLVTVLDGHTGIGGPRGFKKETVLDREVIEGYPRSPVVELRRHRGRGDGRARGHAQAVRRVRRRGWKAASSTRSRSCSAATSCRPAS